MVDEPAGNGLRGDHRGCPAAGGYADPPGACSCRYRDELAAAAVAIVQAMGAGVTGTATGALLDDAARRLDRARAEMQAAACGAV